MDNAFTGFADLGSAFLNSAVPSTVPPVSHFLKTFLRPKRNGKTLLGISIDEIRYELYTKLFFTCAFYLTKSTWGSS